MTKIKTDRFKKMFVKHLERLIYEKMHGEAYRRKEVGDDIYYLFKINNHNNYKNYDVAVNILFSSYEEGAYLNLEAFGFHQSFELTSIEGEDDLKKFFLSLNLVRTLAEIGIFEGDSRN